MFKIFKKKRKVIDYKRIIEKSGLFDSEYYLNKYDDVKLANLNPIDHFIKIGLPKSRKPNCLFEPQWYQRKYKDVDNDGVYPFIHYILFGQKENRNVNNDKKEFHLCKEYHLLKNSNLWDNDYYLKNNSDVEKANINPLEHYLLYGYKEKRNPSKNFNTGFYLSIYKDVEESGMNPLVHFLKYGKKEGRKSIFEDTTFFDVSNITHYFKEEFDIPSLNSKSPIDIIVPVYNGINFLEPLFDSIFKNTSLPYRLLICNDASSDTSVLPLLKKIQNNHSEIEFILLNNENNLGFVGTVNRLVKYVKNHFVLLNTDTEVPPYWIERLMFPICSMKNIATTTPFTNSGTICSFPRYLEDNPIFENLSVEDLDSHFKYINFEKTFLVIPTGVGFCMGVNKNLVDKIGMFDTVFGKGYGEENDFCQRAILEGYQNIHVTNLFVYHKHGGSFLSEEKDKLIKKNLRTLNKKYPTYETQVQHLISENKLQDLRDILYFKIKSKTTYTTLIFDHNLGGGANDYIDNRINQISEEQLICMIRYDFNNSKEFKCKLTFKEKEFNFSAKQLSDLNNFLIQFNVNEIFVNSLVSYAPISSVVKMIIDLQKISLAKLVIPLHDYFPLCPNYTLLNTEEKYCNIPKDHFICNNCLKQHTGEFKIFEKMSDINLWRTDWKKLLEVSEEVLCFSNASKDIFTKAYPMYSKKIILNPHNISGRFNNIYKKNINKDINIIGVLGGINISKGANIIKNMVDYIDTNKINAKIVLIGNISEDIASPSFYKTGHYRYKELPEIIKDFEITQFLIPSIWPETFSYTTDEIIQMGYPLTVFDLGAPAERVMNYKLGKVIKIKDVLDIFKKDYI